MQSTDYIEDARKTGEIERQLEELLETARPGLIGFALARGVSTDGAEDVVQETLLEAWRNLDHLRSPERVEAWLRGICRNLCLRWHSSQTALNRQQPFSTYQAAEEDQKGAGAFEQFTVLDPVEELSQQDLAVLLTRALGYLPETARTPLELYYLADLSQREAAQRLGLSVKALEMRLHRARRQLRQVLNTSLRAEAEDFGLTLDAEARESWQETRIWCMFCARAYLQGRLETLPDERVNLRMRCPHCASQRGGEWFYTGAVDFLRSIHTFRPALKRLLGIPAWLTSDYRQYCSWCQRAVTTYLTGDEQPLGAHTLPRWSGLRWVRHCPACDGLSTTPVGLSIIHHPSAQQFIKQHPRWLNEPETLIDYHGQPAIRVRLVDITSASQLVFLLDQQDGQILAILNA
ncbi:RNA polymerase sigma factor [Dictyobacter aurantiacus]|uniref:RNA polymerase sigma factor n=1 Tax=Dictyobacter aurantiacus TaxID=1936993 RepID=A0A401ZD75_9CHLR|nr:RNA polymerase sigma factor [Dictyobacter aurantiacus]GCE04799.1 hypothetical protein KDAU_21280 [Dictyobacter aurantiacus]